MLALHEASRGLAIAIQTYKVETYSLGNATKPSLRLIVRDEQVKRNRTKPNLKLIFVSSY